MSESAKGKFDPTEFFIKQSGKDYLPIPPRVIWFREEHPIDAGWGIRTQIVEGGFEAERVTVRAEILDPEGRVVATGHSTEIKGPGGKGQGFPEWVEKAETGSIGRALALCGFGTLQALELDERGDVCDSPQTRQGEPRYGPLQNQPKGYAAQELGPNGRQALIQGVLDRAKKAESYGCRITPQPHTATAEELTELGSALNGLLRALPQALERGIPTNETLAPLAPTVRRYREALETLIAAHDAELAEAPPPPAQRAGL